MKFGHLNPCYNFFGAMICAVFGLTANAALAGNSVASHAPSDMELQAIGQHGATITLLGTMGGPPSDINGRRAENSSLLRVAGQDYLIDAGEGVVRRLVENGIWPHSVKRVFITHNHLDHTAGLPAFMGESWFTGWYYHDADYMNKTSTEPFVRIYGPPDTKDMFDGAMKFIGVSARIFNTDDTGAGTMKTPEQVFTVKPINTDGAFYNDGVIKVTAVRNNHYGDPQPQRLTENGDLSYSYRFDTPDGAFVFTGDTGPSEAVTELTKGADVLLTEVLDFELMTTVSIEKEGVKNAPNLRAIKNHMEHQHLSAEAIGKMATQAGVKTVILYHVVPGDLGPEYFPRYIAGVKKYFDGTVIMGTDNFQYTLIKNKESK